MKTAMLWMKYHERSSLGDSDLTDGSNAWYTIATTARNAESSMPNEMTLWYVSITSLSFLNVR